MGEEAVTFSELRKIQKEESSQDGVTDLEESFIPNVRDYLETKKEMSGEGREYRNAKRVFEKILSMRRRKIFREAQICSKSSMDGNVDALLPEEQEFFREAVEIFEDSQELIEKKVFSGDHSIQNYSEPEDQEKIDESGEKGEEEELKGEETEDSYMKVEIKSDVPEFMGTDLESYGPYEKGDQVKMPEENAEILVNRGNAEAVD